MRTSGMPSAGLRSRDESPRGWAASILASPPGWLRKTAALCAVVLLTACATVDRPSLAAFREGVATASSTSSTLFQGINEMAREQQLARVETLATLKESDLSPALDAASRGRWHQALDALVAYASALEVLTDPQQGEGVKQSLEALGGRVDTLREKVDPGSTEGATSGTLAGAFGELARIVVNASAHDEALTIMRGADPHVRAVLTQMADMIGGPPAGATPSPGVRLTVWTSHTLAADAHRVRFLDPANANKKRAIAIAYGDALAAREAADTALARLRGSLLGLADVHTASSQGREADAASMVAFLRQEIGVAQALIEAGKKKDGE